MLRKLVSGVKSATGRRVEEDSNAPPVVPVVAVEAEEGEQQPVPRPKRQNNMSTNLTTEDEPEDDEIGNRSSMYLGNVADLTSTDTASLLEDGMDVFNTRSREWSKSVKLFLTFAERRVQTETECAKTFMRASRTAIDSLTEAEFHSEGTYSSSLLSVLKQQESIAMRQLEFGNATNTEVIQPLVAKRDQHEKSRKRLHAHLAKEQKKLDDNVSALTKARVKFYASVQAWEKAASDKRTEESSSYKVKLDKRSKEEDEAKTRMSAAEEAYRSQIKATNLALDNVRRYTSLILSAYERLLLESDTKYKECLVKFLAIQQTYVDELPSMTRTLHSQATVVDNKEDLRRFVSQVSRGAIWDPKPYVFEKYPSELSTKASLYGDRPDESQLPQDIPSTAAATTGTTTTEFRPRLHSFVKQSSPSRCQHCNLITFKGVQCQTCGTTCHKNCVEKLKQHCEGKTDAKPRALVVFGVPLAKQPRQENSSVPFIVEACIAEAELRGIESEGIYRIAGVKSSVEKLGALFEEFPVKPDLSYESDINAITGCLKAFFRQLPEPVIPYQFYGDFIKACGLDKINMEEVCKVVSFLPAINYDTLAFLIKHLSRVAAKSDVNKMQASNLAIVFGPSLLSSPSAQEDSQLAFFENGQQCVVVERLIQNVDEVFSRADALRSQTQTPGGGVSKSTGTSVESTAVPIEPIALAPALAPAPAPVQQELANTVPPVQYQVLSNSDEDEDTELERIARTTAQRLSKDSSTSKQSSIDPEDDDADIEENIERIARMTEQKLSRETASPKRSPAVTRPTSIAVPLPTFLSVYDKSSTKTSTEDLSQTKDIPTTEPLPSTELKEPFPVRDEVAIEAVLKKPVDEASSTLPSIDTATRSKPASVVTQPVSAVQSPSTRSVSVPNTPKTTNVPASPSASILEDDEDEVELMRKVRLSLSIKKGMSPIVDSFASMSSSSSDSLVDGTVARSNVQTTGAP